MLQIHIRTCLSSNSIYAVCDSCMAECDKYRQSYVTWGIRRSPSGTALCRRNMPTYSLPAFCCDFTSRVARSIHTMRQPVTFGSRVPLCPVFSTLRIRFTQATTSCDDGFDGLSRLINPLLKTAPYLLHYLSLNRQ